VPVDQQVEVELLGVLLARPLGRDVVGRELEGDLLAGAETDGDPVTDVPDHLPAGEVGVERGERADVGRVEGDGFEAGGCGHGRDGAASVRQFPGARWYPASEDLRRSRNDRSASLPVRAMAAS